MRLAITVLGSILLLAVATLAAALYITGPLPNEFQSGHGVAMVPFDPVRFKNLLSANKAVSKLRTAVEKCYDKGVANFAKGKPTGIAACLDDPTKGALAKYAASIQQLDAKPGSLPDCAALDSKGPAIAALTRDLHAYAYCGDPPVIGSPGGAFVDGGWSF